MIRLYCDRCQLPLEYGILMTEDERGVCVYVYGCKPCESRAVDAAILKREEVDRG